MDEQTKVGDVDLTSLPCHADVVSDLPAQNLCTRDSGHEGEHRCKAADVDVRRRREILSPLDAEEHLRNPVPEVPDPETREQAEDILENACREQEERAGGWPRIRVEWHDPKRPQEIISLDEAQQRFGLPDRDRRWFESKAGLAGTGISKSKAPEAIDVYMLWRYTESDCLRDGAAELLEALKSAHFALIRGGYDLASTAATGTQQPLGVQINNAIAKAEGHPANADGQEERRQAPRVENLESAMADYIEGEASESERIEAQVCQECGYAAGIHDPMCSRAVPR